MQNLKSCPFCDKPPSFKAKRHTIECIPCGYSMQERSQDSLHGEYVSEINKRLFDKWNKRAYEVQIKALEADASYWKNILEQRKEQLIERIDELEDIIRDIDKVTFYDVEEGVSKLNSLIHKANVNES